MKAKKITSKIIAVTMMLFVLFQTEKALAQITMKTGTYTGNGSADIPISGLGFKPDIVIVKADHNHEAQIRTSSLGAGDVSKTMVGALTSVGYTSRVKSLDADGFTIGTNTDVNVNGKNYYWTAIKEAGGSIKIGTYTGNAINNRSIDVGFEPALVIVFATLNQASIFRIKEMPNDFYSTFGGATGSNGIKTFSGNNFVIGTDDRANKSGFEYHYIAFKQTTGAFITGMYTGNVTDNRQINAVGFMPEYVFVKSELNNLTVQRSSSMTGDFSIEFSAASDSDPNKIQGFLPLGFEIGTQAQVNTNKRNYYWAAFRSGGCVNTSSSEDIAICSGDSYTTADGTILSEEGSYVSHILNAAGCDSAITTNLTINELPTVTASNVSGLLNESVALTGTPAGGTFSVANPHTIIESTVYTYTYTDPVTTCTNSATGTITLISPPPPGQPLTLFSYKDSYMREGHENTNEGANPLLRITNSGDNRAIVAFDLTGVSLAGLVSATLYLNIYDNADNWGGDAPGTRYVDVHRVTKDWTEGNGWNDQGKFRGTGAGVTWMCPTDDDIHNQSPNGLTWNGIPVSSNGGTYAPATAPGVLHYNDLLGDVSWDVTADVLAGVEFGWIIRKREENKNGRVWYCSREFPDLTKVPRLVLAYTNDNVVVIGDTRNEEVATDMVKEETAIINHFAIFPNPSSQYFTLQVNADTDENNILTITDLAGRVVLYTNLQLQNGMNQYTVNVADFSAGIYIVSLQTRNGASAMKLVIAR